MLLNFFKDKIINNKTKEKLYSFNQAEIEEYNKLGKEKINKLSKTNINNTPLTNNDKEEDYIIDTDTSIQDKNIDEGITKIIPKEEEKQKFSYLNLPKKEQEKIIKTWKETNIDELNNYIEKGKDLIEHNYTITYYDSASKYIKEIRTKYSIIIKYLIGFNNEKNGELNSTLFSKNEDEEWHYLKNYIKLLEKIKSLHK